MEASREYRRGDLEPLTGGAVMTPNFGELAEQISKTLGVLDSPDAKKAVIAAALKDAYFQGMADSHREAQDKSSLHEADRTLRRAVGKKFATPPCLIATPTSVFEFSFTHDAGNHEPPRLQGPRLEPHRSGRFRSSPF